MPVGHLWACLWLGGIWGDLQLEKNWCFFNINRSSTVPFTTTPFHHRSTTAPFATPPFHHRSITVPPSFHEVFHGGLQWDIQWIFHGIFHWISTGISEGRSSELTPGFDPAPPSDMIQGGSHVQARNMVLAADSSLPGNLSGPLQFPECWSLWQSIPKTINPKPWTQTLKPKP